MGSLGASAPPRPPGFESRRLDGAVLLFRPGTVGEASADDLAGAVTSARRRLRPLIDTTGDFEPQVLLVDPFPDPADPSRLVARGAVAEPERGQLWLVVTAEAPPEPPERGLALVFGARLPAGPELTLLLEGYGMRAARGPDPTPFLRELDLPPFEDAGELRPHMARAFVDFLIAQAGEPEFLAFLASVQPGRVDEAANERFGDDLAGLEKRWRQSIVGGAGSIPTGQFVRLAMTYLRPYWRREIELFVLSLFGLAFTLVFPFAMRALIDTAIPSGDFGQVASILGLLAVAFAITLVASLRRTYQVVYVGAGVIRDIRARMFERLQSLEPSWFANREAGDVVARVITDVEQLELGLSQSMREGVVQTLTLIATGVVMMILNPLLGAVVLITAPLVALIYKLMGAEAQRRSLATQQLLGGVTSVVSENLSAQPVVKAFGLERHETGRLGEANERLFRSELRLHLFGGMFAVSVEMIMTLLRLGVLGLGAYLIFHGHLTIGGLVAFTTVMGSVLAPVTVLTTIGQQIQTSTGSLVRINEILDATPEVTDAHEAVTLPRLSHALELHDVMFSYTPERRVLHGVSAHIPAGARAAFVGPSGAGKSSILQLLMRFQDPDDGAVTLDGVDLRSGTLASLRDQTGVVLQETFLFNTSIRENIRLGLPGASDAEVEAAGRAARLDEVVAQAPEGWDTGVGERGARLSGGQRQRVAIARALLRNPTLLLLDEATSALDPRTEHEIAATLAEAATGRTTIAITHRLHSVRDYDKIFVIVDGRLAEEGTHDELLATGGTYTELWDEQHGGVLGAEEAVDVRSALARLPLFETLRPDELAEVEGALRPLELQPGDRVAEGGGRLVIVARGRAVAVVPSVGGAGMVRLAELRPGQAFGLSALLGDESGAMLEADGPLSLAVLDDQAIEALSGRFPAIAAALTGERAAASGPSGGVRLEPRSAVMDSTALDRVFRVLPSTSTRSAGGVHRLPGLAASGVMERPPILEPGP